MKHKRKKIESSCACIRNHVTTFTGNKSMEFTIKGKKMYYCYGLSWDDNLNYYDECISCPKFIYGEQIDIDREMADKQGDII